MEFVSAQWFYYAKYYKKKFFRAIRTSRSINIVITFLIFNVKYKLEAKIKSEFHVSFKMVFWIFNFMNFPCGSLTHRCTSRLSLSSSNFLSHRSRIDRLHQAVEGVMLFIVHMFNTRVNFA